MKTILAAVLLGAVGWFLPMDAIDAAARTIVLAIALMAAGIFPCMTLTVNAMKGEERSPAMVEDLYTELDKLLKVLVVAFILAVLTVLALAITAASITAKAPDLASQLGAVMAGVALGLFMSRVAAIGKAFFALLEINRKHALLVARKRVRGNRDEALEEGRKEHFVADEPQPRKLTKVG